MSPSEGRGDPMSGWRDELAVLAKVMETLEPLTMHERLRVLEAVATIYGEDDTARQARIARARLGPSAPDLTNSKSPAPL